MRKIGEDYWNDNEGLKKQLIRLEDGLVDDKFQLNEEQKDILKDLKNARLVAKALGDDETAIRISRAIAAFISNPYKEKDEIFNSEFVDEFYEKEVYN